MTRFWQFIHALSLKHVPARSSKHLCCRDCGLAIHKSDRYRVLEVRHVNCRDTKLMGQMALPEALRGLVGE